MILKPVWWKVLTAALLAVMVMFVKLPFIGNVLPWKNILGIAAFYLMYVLFSKINYSEKTARILSFFSSISFSVYLIHHFVMIQIIERFGTKNLAFTYFMALIITTLTACAISNITNKLK